MDALGQVVIRKHFVGYDVLLGCVYLGYLVLEYLWVFTQMAWHNGLGYLKLGILVWVRVVGRHVWRVVNTHRCRVWWLEVTDRLLYPRS